MRYVERHWTGNRRDSCYFLEEIRKRPVFFNRGRFNFYRVFAPFLISHPQGMRNLFGTPQEFAEFKSRFRHWDFGG